MAHTVLRAIDGLRMVQHSPPRRVGSLAACLGAGSEIVGQVSFGPGGPPGCGADVEPRRSAAIGLGISVDQAARAECRADRPLIPCARSFLASRNPRVGWLGISLGTARARNGGAPMSSDWTQSTSLVARLHNRAITAGDDIALVFEDASGQRHPVTVGELDEGARAVAARLADSGAEPGSTAMIIHNPGVET